MASSKDLIEIRMKLLGNREVVSGSKSASKAIKGVGKATESTAVKSKAAARVNSGLTNSYKSLGRTAKWGLGFLGVGGVLAIESAIHATEELSKTTTGLARNMGLSTEAASRWGAVAMAREIDSKQLGMAMGTLGKHFVEAARKGGTALTPFHQLGISQEEIAKGAHNTNAAIMITAKAFGEAEGGPVRQAAAMGLLGKAWSTVLPLMSGGTKELQEQLHWADEFGVTLNSHTNEAIMEMVQAQRKNKIAMLGLQLALTKALMPAIKAGDDQLQEFIATLNNPHLSAEQKISQISHQFLMLEGDLVKLIEQALPKIAEQGGHLGVALAGAIWHGFRQSNVVGKLVIGAWIFDAFGGRTLVKAGARRVGGMIGTELSIGLVAGVTGGFIAAEVFEHLEPRTQREIVQWGWNAGSNFINFFVKAVNIGIHEINETLNNANALAFIGVEAPQIGEVGEVGGPPGPPVGKGTAPGILGGGHMSNAEKRHNYEALWGKPPPLGPPPWPTPHKGHRHHHQRTAAPRAATQSPKRELMRAPAGGRGGGAGSSRPIHITVQSVLDGKVVAESTTAHALNEAAFT